MLVVLSNKVGPPSGGTESVSGHTRPAMRCCFDGQRCQRIQSSQRSSLRGQSFPLVKKLLRSDVKETTEGVVRLEMFTESIMAATVTLQYIYTGDVQIFTEDVGNARDLIVMADYFFLTY